MRKRRHRKWGVDIPHSPITSKAYIPKKVKISQVYDYRHTHVIKKLELRRQISKEIFGKISLPLYDKGYQCVRD